MTRNVVAVTIAIIVALSAAYATAAQAAPAAAKGHTDVSSIHFTSISNTSSP